MVFTLYSKNLCYSIWPLAVFRKTRKAVGLQVKWYRELTIQTKPLNYILKYYYTLFQSRVTQFSVSASFKVLWSKKI